jgi:hypothetical protein
MDTLILRRLVKVSNELALWDSPNGITIPASADLSAIISLNKSLNVRELGKLSKAYEHELYDMAAEYVWSRAINVLKERVLQLGEEFVLEMLGKEGSDAYEISEVEVINLAADLGFVNKKAKLDFMHNVEIINYYASRDADEEMHMLDSAKILKTCFQFVLGLEETDFSFSFNDFREKLKLGTLQEEDLIYKALLDSPYFYKRTTVNTLLNLARKSEGGELDHVLSNIASIIPAIWDSLLSDDRWPIGIAYSEEVNKGNKKLVGALKSVLVKVKGFNYVPESLRSNTFIEYAKKLIEAHDGFNNFYNEPAAAKALHSLGTIPTPALGICITSSLLSKLGNHYSHAYDAQEYVDKIFRSLSNDRWEYYFNKVFEGDERVLLKLINDGKPLNRWLEFVHEFLDVDQLSIKNSQVSRLLEDSYKGKVSPVKRKAKSLFDQLR